MHNLSLLDADILIDLPQQQLILPQLNQVFQISSALNGIGEAENSGKTPRGWHCIEQKIGHHACLNSVFVGRQFTGEIYNAELADHYPNRDWILSRILWLKGLEVGFNAGEGCDTWQRYIYIHGTPDINPMGVPLSHGCIRMHNSDVSKLFDLVDEKALVFISEHSLKESL